MGPIQLVLVAWAMLLSPAFGDTRHLRHESIHDLYLRLTKQVEAEAERALLGEQKSFGHADRILAEGQRAFARELAALESGDEPENQPRAAESPSVDDGYSEQEKECLSKRKFLYPGDGKCYDLTKKGPCEAMELFLLEENESESALLRPKCVKKKCSEPNEIWSSTTNSCETRTTIKNQFCNEANTEVTIDYYGNGICRCRNVYGEFTVNGKIKCHEYYQRGPCDSGKVVTYDPQVGEAVCSEDLCLQLNRESSVGSSKNSRRRVSKKTYAPLEGKGKCIELNSAEFCSAVSNQSRYIIDPDALVPRCSSASVALHVVDSPVLCRLDDNRNCREEVVVKQEDRLVYLLQLKKKLRKRS